MDSIGCAIGGYATEAGKQIVAQAKEFKGAGEAAIIADGSLVSAPFACWANSSLANVLDMDDVFAGTAHQGNCLVPTALGIGQAMKKSGLDVLRAVILGFEVGSRIIMYCWPSPSKARTYFPSTWQVFDAVTVTGSLLDLGPKELYHAYGLAGTVPSPADRHAEVRGTSYGLFKERIRVDYIDRNLLDPDGEKGCTRHRSDLRRGCWILDDHGIGLPRF